MNEFLHKPGFLGTNANFAADLTLVIMLLAAALFSLGYLMARRKRYETHRWIQTGAASLNAIVILWMMILPFRDFIIQDKGGPRPNYFYTITGLHALLGFIALVFGVFVVLRGNKLVPKALRFKNYRLFMRTSYGLYMGATLLGVLVYLAWFVFLPIPPTY